jgi:all-trans-retinol 13,14-reductase
MESFDAVIIGAGAGGLSAAACLARAGKKVLIVEQDNHIGGTAHVFKRGGFTFPAGPISVTVPDYITLFLSRLDIEEAPCFIRDHFQIRRGGDIDVMISVPLDQLAKQLSDYFPQERKGIIQVIKILDEVIDALDALHPEDLIENDPYCITDSAARAVIERWGRVSATDILDGYLQDEKIKDLLGSQGTAKTVMSVVLLAQMWRFMSKKGIWYIKGGVSKVPELLAERLRAFGGEIRPGERVERIMIREGVVTGVELEGGALIHSPIVISDADYKETLLKLLPQGAIPEDEQDAVSRLPLTSSAFTVYLGIKKELVDLCVFRGHHLLVKLKEGEPVTWEKKKPDMEDFLQDEIWISWWSRHDPELAPAGCEALIIKVMAPFDRFAPFSGSSRGRHNELYYSMKEDLADALVSAAEKVIPGLSSAIVVREVATPLTYQYWGHRTEGSLAGWSWKFADHPEPWIHSFTVTPVPGLLVVGLQAFTHLFNGGMGTAIYSGEYAADIVLSGRGRNRYKREEKNN